MDARMYGQKGRRDKQKPVVEDKEERRKGEEEKTKRETKVISGLF